MGLMDETSNGQQPWWISAVYKIGIPSAIALYMVWFLSVQVRDRLDLVEAKLNHHVSSSEVLVEQNKQLVRQNERTLQILTQICINSSATNQERNQCFQ